jgi:hypothetical protein
MFPFVSPPLMPVPLLVRGRRGHPFWSSHVDTHFNLLFSALHPPTCLHMYSGKDTRLQCFDPALNQQSPTEVRACFAVYRVLHARAPLGSSRAPAMKHRTTISVAITHTHLHTMERDTHTHMDGTPSFPLFSRPRASTACPARLCHSTPLSLSVCVCGVLICLLCIGRSPHLPHCPR